MFSASRAVGVLAMLLLFLPGCVTKGRYDMLASDRDSIAAERDSLAERAAKLQSELEATRFEREEALASLAASQAAMDQLQAHESIVDVLKRLAGKVDHVDFDSLRGQVV